MDEIESLQNEVAKLKAQVNIASISISISISISMSIIAKVIINIIILRV